VEFPEAQTCCGQMHGNTGDAEHGQRLVRRWERVFEGSQVVVSLPGTRSGTPSSGARGLSTCSSWRRKVAASDMEPTRILVVANRTAATPLLLDEVRACAAAGPCRFTLLIPDADNRTAADWTLDLALPLLEQAAGAPVEGIVSGPYALEAVYDAVRDGSFDEVIVSTLPRRFSRWINRDLPRLIESLGMPVTVVGASAEAPTSAGTSASR
jgi:hypothetical protein